MEGSKVFDNESKVQSSSENDSNMVKTLKLESFDLNDSNNDTQSFSLLPKSVLSWNSPGSALKGKHQIPPKFPGVLKAEVAGELSEFSRRYVKPCASLLSLAPAAEFRLCSEPPAASTVDIGSPLNIVGTPAVDGYSWRKYGQKQVKNTNTYRSYYRCTHSGCGAKKKVVQCEHSRYVIDIVHIGDHNHCPTRRSCNRSKWLKSSEKNSVTEHTEVPRIQQVDGSVINHANAHISSLNSKSSEELCANICTGIVKAEEEHGEMLESNQPCSSNGGLRKSSSCWIANTEVQEKLDSENNPEMGKEHSNNNRRESVLTATKKHKTVVQDARISPDGYTWRKYGQKFVKGNSHTRSYYRCKVAGCPARKQIVKAINGEMENVITYEGDHNHDVRIDDANVLVSSTAPVTPANNKNTGTLTTQNPLTNLSEEKEQESRGVKVPKNGVAEDNISGAKNIEVTSDKKIDSSDTNSANVRQSSDQKSGSEPHSSTICDCGVRKVKVEDQHEDILESKQVFSSNGRGSQQSSSSWIADTEIQEKNDFDPDPSPKKRKDVSDSICSDSAEATKKHKVVQDAAAGKISHDGCRWRKYGQKLVKGNSHTRSYYRCTSTGCPARKHVETDINDTTAVTVAFRGEHKHDVPVIRKERVPDNPATSADDGISEKIETLTITRCLRKEAENGDGEFLGERVMELGGERALESAQTLLSIKDEVRQRVSAEVCRGEPVTE